MIRQVSWGEESAEFAAAPARADRSRPTRDAVRADDMPSRAADLSRRLEQVVVQGRLVQRAEAIT